MTSRKESGSLAVPRKISAKRWKNTTDGSSDDDDDDKYASAVGSLEKLPYLLSAESPTLQRLSSSSQSEAMMTARQMSEANSSMSEQDDQSAGMFSMSTVSQKLINMYSSAKERMWGEDYWVPSDPTVIVRFPMEALQNCERILPEEDDIQTNPSFSIVCRETDESPLYHVTFSVAAKKNKLRHEIPTLSIFRSKDVHAVTDLYQSCILSAELFSRLDVNDVSQISGLLAKFKLHPLWQAVHIAARMGNIDYFEEKKRKEGEEKLKKLLSTRSHPEGYYPLLIAIQSNMVTLVDGLLSLGADPALIDANGNNAMHFAALVSSPMLEALWKHDSTHELLNRVNDDGCTPLFLAIRNASPLCVSTLVHFGAALKTDYKGNNPLCEAMQSKGTTISVLESLLKASPESLTERDSTSGNSPLHVALYKQPMVALLQLQHGNIDINAVNFAGQTALHVNALRENLGCVFTLASHGIDLNLQDNNGDTALHVAVSKSNLMMTRALLCLGASVNIKNRHGDTPRHLAAKLHSNQRKDILRSLVIGGAERCDRDKVGCRSECAHMRSKIGKVRSGSSVGGLLKGASSDTLGADSLDEDSTASMNSIDEEFLEDITGKEPAVKDAPTHEFRQQLCYKAMRKRAQECLKKGGHGCNRRINLLALDGGGIRGLVTIQILLALEKLLGEPVFDYFDWVAGTSTGSYVAGGLAQGRSLRECQHIYLRFKDTIFESWSRPYNTEAVEKFMQEELGADCTLAEVRWPRLMITTVRCDVFPVKLEFFRNYTLPLSEEENEKLGFFRPSDVKLWKALRCSSAAPTFFSSVDSKYIDGGLISNNPSLDLLSEAHLWNTALQYTDQSENDQVSIGCLLSIGTGMNEPQPMDMIDFNFSLVGNPFSTATAMRNLGVILIDQVTATEGVPVSRSRSWCHSLGVPYFRLCAPLSQDIQLDTKNDEEIAQMMWEAMEYACARKQEMVDLVELLRLLGKSEHRRHLFTDVETGFRDMQTQTSVNISGADDGNTPSFTLN